jgi:hypothetical protein
VVALGLLKAVVALGHFNAVVELASFNAVVELSRLGDLPYLGVLVPSSSVELLLLGAVVELARLGAVLWSPLVTHISTVAPCRARGFRRIQRSGGPLNRPVPFTCARGGLRSVHPLFRP